MLFTDFFESPLGITHIEASEKGVNRISLNQNTITSANPNEFTQQTIQELKEYFDKKRTLFSIPLDLQGTEFQLRVWQELLKIPYGKTTSYAQIAKNLGDVKTIRAVGNANGKNPVWIVVPCHRVIGSDGSLVGYAGGLDVKRKLLELEGAITQLNLF